MTRHIDAKASEDKSMTDDEVLRVLELAMMRNIHRDDSPPPEELARWRAALDAVAALQAERDALIARNRGLVRLNEATEQRADRAESALEALRGQVAGLVVEFRARAKRASYSDDADLAINDCADELAALLAIKERMG